MCKLKYKILLGKFWANFGQILPTRLKYKLFAFLGELAKEKTFIFQKPQFRKFGQKMQTLQLKNYGNKLYLKKDLFREAELEHKCTLYATTCAGFIIISKFPISGDLKIQAAKNQNWLEEMDRKLKEMDDRMKVQLMTMLSAVGKFIKNKKKEVVCVDRVS